MESELEQMQAIYQTVVTFMVNYSFQLIGAIIIVLIGMLVAQKVGKLVLRLCQSRKLDITFSRFIANTVRIVIIVMVAIIALGKIGISITPFVAAVGALSLGAGLAMQGLLSNYGAGLNIILVRPFVIGDTISVNGVKGLVQEVHLAYTIMTDEDGVLITVPNKHIVGEILHNSQADSMVELSVGIAYHCKPLEAIRSIGLALANLDGLSTERAPLIGIEQFGDSSIDIGVRMWVKTDRLYECRYQANMAIYEALQASGIEIPFPQRDVRVLRDTA